MGLETAAILAAGVGSRLRPITTSQPKCMTKVNGKPILGYQLDALKDAGVKNVKIVVGYEAEKVIEYCRDYQGLDIQIFVNEDYENNNNMFSMYLLRHELKGKPFAFCNADVVYDKRIVAAVCRTTDVSCIAVDAGTYDAESMKVVLDESGRIIGIRKTFGEAEAFGRSVDLYGLTAEDSETFFGEIESIVDGTGNVREWTEVALDRLCGAGRIRFVPADIHGYAWVEIDNYDDLARADMLFSGFDLDKYKAVFFDIDGTIAVGDKPIEGAVEFIEDLRKSGKHVFFVTNNSSRSKSDYVLKLKKLGVPSSEAEIILSTDGMIDLLKSKSHSKVFCIGTESMRLQLKAAGIDHVEDDPEVVVLGYDTELTYAKLSRACALINKGMEYYATHKDIFCPSLNGPIPDIGTLIKTIEMTTGKSPKAILGKPSKSMLSHLVGDIYQPEESLFVGDRLYTDKVLADVLGMGFICVLSGETNREDLQSFGEADWPSLVIKSVGEI